jgi:CDGSH-type Zn-finger protein
MTEPEPIPGVTISVRDNGSLKVAGPITILDAEGNPFTLPPGTAVALCRCGHSSTKPFCDATHRAIGFRSMPRADGRDLAAGSNEGDGPA